MALSRIVLSLDAERDLDSLFDFIALDSGVDRAEAILRRIDETLELLATMPGVGRVRIDLDGRPRTFAVWPWVIVYEPLSPGQGIVVCALSTDAETFSARSGDKESRPNDQQ